MLQKENYVDFEEQEIINWSSIEYYTSILPQNKNVLFGAYEGKLIEDFRDNTSTNFTINMLVQKINSNPAFNIDGALFELLIGHADKDILCQYNVTGTFDPKIIKFVINSEEAMYYFRAINRTKYNGLYVGNIIKANKITKEVKVKSKLELIDIRNIDYTCLE